MNKKISFPIAIIIILVCAVLTVLLVWQYGLIPEISWEGIPFPKPEIICGKTDPLYCKNDNDCICADAESEYPGCFLGNKNYYEKCGDKISCFDLCTGWGQPPVKCINNQCTNSYEIEGCKIKSPDRDGYLLKICRYLKEHEDTIVPNKEPDKYTIKKTEEGQYQGKDVLVIRLDCCGTGDLAYVDKETNEVIGFSPGDL